MNRSLGLISIAVVALNMDVVGGGVTSSLAATGQKLWGQKIGGAIGGGVITYSVNGAQKVAVATGYVSPVFPAEIRRAKIAILGVQ
jgi:alcohol dehydrogenase (cytochrome c)